MKQNMHRMSLLLTTTLMTALLATSVYGQEQFSGIAEAIPLRIERKADAIHIDFKFVVHDHNLKIRSLNSVDFVFVLHSGSYVKSFSVLSLKGNRNYKSYKRSLDVMSRRELIAYQLARTNYEVVNFNRRSSRYIYHSVVIPCKSWMTDIRIELLKYYSRCGMAIFISSQPLTLDQQK